MRLYWFGLLSHWPLQKAHDKFYMVQELFHFVRNWMSHHDTCFVIIQIPDALHLFVLQALLF